MSHGQAQAIRLRPATPADIDALWALRTRCVREVCRSHYPPAVIAAWAASPAPAGYPRLLGGGAGVLAEAADGRLLGFAVADLEGNEIDGLFVDPEHHGAGLGGRLLRAVEAKLPAGTRIHVAAALNAVGFYQAHGYAVLRAGRYPHPGGFFLDCVFMAKQVALAVR